MSPISSLPLAARVRLAYVDHLLTTCGQVNRSDLMVAFGISAPQASIDFTNFKAAFCGRMAYDLSSKQYFPSRDEAVFSAEQRFAAAGIVAHFSGGFGHA